MRLAQIHSRSSKSGLPLSERNWVWKLCTKWWSLTESQISLLKSWRVLKNRVNRYWRVSKAVTVPWKVMKSKKFVIEPARILTNLQRVLNSLRESQESLKRSSIFDYGRNFMNSQWVLNQNVSDRDYWRWITVGGGVEFFNWDAPHFGSQRAKKCLSLCYCFELVKQVKTSQNVEIFQLRATDFSTEANCQTFERRLLPILASRPCISGILNKSERVLGMSTENWIILAGLENCFVFPSVKETLDSIATNVENSPKMAEQSRI